MTNKESQSFYLAIVDHNLHLSYFSSEENISNHQKKYLMPDSLDDNLNEGHAQLSQDKTIGTLYQS